MIDNQHLLARQPQGGTIDHYCYYWNYDESIDATGAMILYGMGNNLSENHFVRCKLRQLLSVSLRPLDQSKDEQGHGEATLGPLSPGNASVLL
jgi:hypothetical protein